MSRRPVLTLLALLAAAAVSPIRSQDIAPPLSTVVRKNLAPISDAALDVSFPPVVEAQLENGLTVLIVENHSTPLVSVQLNIGGAGALYDPSGLEGLAGLTASMLREGTPDRTNIEIGEDMDRLGATLTSGAAAGSPVATLAASGLRRNMDEWFAVLGDVLLRPEFPGSSLVRLKSQGRLGLRQQRTAASFHAERQYYEAVYGDHPAASRNLTEASLEAVTVEVIAEWHGERYAPQNSVLAITGDVDPDSIVSWLEEQLGGWRPNGFVAEMPPALELQEPRRIDLVDRPGAPQTLLVVGNLAIDRGHPDYVDVRVVNDLLGGGPASRLFQASGRDESDPFVAFSTISALEYPGPWTISAAFRTGSTAAAMAGVFNELRRLRTEPVSGAELQAAQRSVAAGFALSLEEPESLLSYAILRWSYQLPADYWDTYPAKVSAVTGEDVESIARVYLDPDRMHIVVVGDAARILSAVENYGPVAIFDLEGNPLN